ncbi:MAG: hypothetical protein XD98_0226 [Microgenomates bacterium 39_6]|nr:MAG: hypothetical protein XD98_0226 [Microgenomates bacterium 39_6]
MIKPKRKTQPKAKNLTQSVREEIEAVVQEAVDQVVPTENIQSVTNPPPRPDYKNDALSSSEEEIVIDNKEKELREVRRRLLDLKRESALSEKKLFQERKEKADKRNPVVEGIEMKEEEKKEPKDKDANSPPLPPPETTSRPKRGLPFGIGQPEKRKRR